MTDTHLPITFEERHHQRIPRALIVFAVIVVFSLTQGPVYLVWQLVTPEWDTTSVDLAIVASFLLLYAIAMVTTRWPSFCSVVRQPRIAALAALTVWLALSSAWSVAPASTFVSSVCFAGTVVAGYWFAQQFTPEQQARAVFIGTALGVVISAALLVLDWPRARDQWGQWVGVYGNRNSLAPVAAVCLGSGCFVLSGFRSIGPLSRRVAAVVLVVVVQALSTILLVGSKSRTSVLALAAVVGALALNGAISRMARSTAARAGLLAGCLTVAGVAVLAAGDTISTVLGRGEGLNGRDLIWRATLDAARQHPIAGWGFRAIWNDPDFRVVARLDPVITDAHNGYLELLVGAGAVALVLLLVSLCFVTRDLLATNDVTQPLSLLHWPLALITFGAAASLFETFVVGNQLLWMLMVAGMVSPVIAHRSWRPVIALGAASRPDAGRGGTE